MKTSQVQKLTLLALVIALDVVLSPIMRIEGMAPMSSVINIIAGVLLGPAYATVMAASCGVLRMLLLGIPPLALTGSVLGALLAGWGYRLTGGQVWGSMVGEIIGTGILGSLLSYPVMVWFTGSQQGLYWLIYTPRFVGASFIGAAMAGFVLFKLKETRVFKKAQALFMEMTHKEA